MKELGEQWIEVIDGKKHMLKAVNSTYNCNGCAYLCDNGKCSHESIIECPVYKIDAIIKDLGILNEDGCLPSDFGVYPEVYEHTLMGIDGYMVKAYTSEPHIGKYAWGKTKQEAVDAWNRRE